MRRSLAFVAVVFLMLFSGGPPALAAPSTSVEKAAPLDLATMMLIPADVKRPQATIWGGGRFFTDSYLPAKAAKLKAAGNLGGFEQWIGPKTADRDYQIASSLEEYKDATGAAAGFVAFQGTGRTPVAGVKTIGDESVLFRTTGSDPYDSSRPDYGLILDFRIGRLVATIYVDSYTSAKPHAAEALALGDIMAARIRKALAGDPTQPGLSNQAVRFKVDLKASFQDGYFRLNGEDRIGWEGDLAEGQATFAQVYADATNVLMVGQYVSMKNGAPWERVRLVQFPTSAAASSWIKDYERQSERAGNGWDNVKPVAGARTFGDESRTVTFQWTKGSGSSSRTVYGATIVARYGATAVIIRIEGYRPVPVALVEQMMATQAKCLKSTANCPRVTPSKELLDLTVPPTTGWAQPASAASGSAIADTRRLVPTSA